MNASDLPRSVPFFDFPGLFREHEREYAEVMRCTAAKGGFILQTDVVEFEDRLARFVGARHAIGVSDCTNAMTLGFRAMGLKPGDEVVIPSHTFLATAQAIHFAGGIVVPVELLPDGTVDPADMERAITPRTRALMPVQVNGRICDMDAIADIARRHLLPIVEDAAQALGATYKGRCAGTFGAWGSFSFYPSKLLGCFGDGGALVTDDDEIARLVRAMRNHGANEHKVLGGEAEVWGTNSRLDNIHAAILNHKFPLLPAHLERRREIARRYAAAFADLDELTLPPGPDGDADRYDCFQNYEIESPRRDQLKAYLAANGVGTIIQWGGTAVHQFRRLGFTQHLPRTDRFFERCLLLPMNHLLDDSAVAHVCVMVRRFHGRDA